MVNLNNLIMKKVIFSIFIICVIYQSAFGQNKKEKIEILNFRIDSLNMVINSKNIEIYNKDTIIMDLKSQIATINSNLANKELEVISLKKRLFDKDSELYKKTNEIISLNELINKLKDSIIISKQKVEKLTFHIPPPSGDGTGVCEVTLTIDNFFLLATETCGGHDDWGRTESEEELFKIQFKRDFKYKVSELINTEMGSSFGCEYFEIKENYLFLYDENDNIINDWFCTVGGFALNYKEGMETCDCIFSPSKN
jgi:hypothetical protein